MNESKCPLRNRDISSKDDDEKESICNWRTSSLSQGLPLIPMLL